MMMIARREKVREMFLQRREKKRNATVTRLFIFGKNVRKIANFQKWDEKISNS